MKNKLLITTALAALSVFGNAYADYIGEPETDLVINDEQTISDKDLYYYKSISVAKDGTLNLSNADIKTTDKKSPETDITINGKLDLKNSVLEAGNDDDELPNNSNMLLDGATVTMNDSALEANGNITIKDTTLTSSNKTSENFGIWADSKINVENSRIEMTDSYLAAAGDINVDGGNLSFTNASGKGLGFTPGGGEGIFGSVVSVAGNGSINISDGTVTLKDTALDAVRGINIKGGTVNLRSTNDHTFATLWSAGDIILSGGEINVEGGAVNTFYKVNGEDKTGSIIISGATINVKKEKVLNLGAKGDIKLASGTINIEDDAELTVSDNYNDNWTFDTDNPGTLQISQNGIINLAGNITANINGNGTINFKSGIHEITGNINMTDGGVMNVGLSDAIIIGDVTFNSGSTLKLEIADSGNGSLQAANITGKEGAKLALNITKKIKVSDTLENVALLKGNVDNHFTNEISNNRYKVTSEDGKNFNITYKNSASDVVADAGGSANNAATAEAWDTVTSSPTASANAKAVASVLNDLSQNNEQAYMAALTAVAPEVAPMVQKTQTETANQVFGAVSTRLTGGSISTGGEGMSSGDSNPDAAVWVQGMFNKSKLDDTSKAKGFDADSNGIAFGAEKFVTDDTKVGVGYAYTNTDIDGFMRSTDVDTHTAIVYGEYKPSNWYVNGIATYGWSDYEENKSVAGVGVKADYDVETFGLQAMTGYDMLVNGLGITPEAGLRYVHIKQDAYKDSADQKVSGNDSDILTGVIGAKISKNFELSNGMNIKPEARIAATYDLMNDDVNSVVTLANGSAYAVEGEALDRFGMEFGAGVTAEVNDNVELSLGYEGKFREDYQDHTGLINAKYKF